MFSKDLSLLAIGDEATPGTAVTPTAVVRIREPDISPSVEMAGEKMATGDHGNTEMYPGEQTGEVKGYTYLSLPPSLATAPDWSILATMCGLVRTVHGSTGQSWTDTIAGDLTSKTAWLLKKEPGAAPQQRSLCLKGVMASLKISAGKRGEPFKLEFSGKGAYYSEADIINASLINLGAVNTTNGMRLLGWTATLNGITVRLDSVEVDQQNDLSQIPNQGDSSGTGVLQYFVKQRKATAKISVELPRVATQDFRTYWINSTISALSLANGGSGASLFTMKAPRCQISDVKYKDIGGVEYADISLNFLRNGGSDAAMADETSFELLHGSKT